jgi:hypothetical protein
LAELDAGEHLHCDVELAPAPLGNLPFVTPSLSRISSSHSAGWALRSRQRALGGQGGSQTGACGGRRSLVLRLQGLLSPKHCGLGSGRARWLWMVTTCDRKIYVETPGVACLCGATGVAGELQRPSTDSWESPVGCCRMGGLTLTLGQGGGAHCAPHRLTTGRPAASGCLAPSALPLPAEATTHVPAYQ